MQIKPLFLVAGIALFGAAGLPPSPRLIATAEAAGSNLGDIGSFRVIVVDTIKLVDAGDLVAARARIKDFETAWDDAEPSLKPRAAAVWHRVDRAADGAYEPLRADRPTAAACKAALADLLAAIDAANAPA